MEKIFLIPGITGSRLGLTMNSPDVWPPTVEEVIWGYNRLDEVLDPKLIATGIWVETEIIPGWSVPVYKPLIEKLWQITQGLADAELVIFPYDWRLDIWKSTVPVLAKEIEKQVDAGASSITLVCHSMGSLVARLLLESQKYKTASWFSRIQRLICICGPHLGAPKALGRALGCEARSLGLDADDWRTVTNDPRYPAGYQLFPVPEREVLYEVSTSPSKPVDIYANGDDYGLTESSLKAAQESWEKLKHGARPGSVQYVFIAGEGLDTSSAYLFNKLRYVETVPNDGDATVPLWSAKPGGPVKTYEMLGEHVGILGTVQLSQTLDQIFGLPMISAFALEAPGVTINVNKDTFAPNEMMQVLILPDAPMRNFNGHLTMSNIPISKPSDSPEFVPHGVGTAMQYNGPEISRLSVRLTAPPNPGAYILKFEGTTHQSTEASSVMFFVSAPSKMSMKPSGPKAAKPKRAQKQSKSAKKKRKK
jgi:Lecithin:cholesterol acyltransferase